MAFNYDYNVPSIVFEVDPVNMFDEAFVNAKKYLELVVDCIVSMIVVWNSLKLGWAGNTADEAQQFNTYFDTVTTEFFGREDGPDGAVFKVWGSAVIAADNFGFCEDSVTQMFRDILASLDAPPSGNSMFGIRNFTDPPITEVN